MNEGFREAGLGSRQSARPARAATVAGSQPESVAGRLERAATLRAEIEQRVETIRLDLVNLAPYGFHADAAEIIAARRERVSREIQNVRDLTLKVFLAEVALHRFEGRDETADRLLAKLTAGQPIQMRTKNAIVIRLGDGQMFLNLMAPESKA